MMQKKAVIKDKLTEWQIEYNKLIMKAGDLALSGLPIDPNDIKKAGELRIRISCFEFVLCEGFFKA